MVTAESRKKITTTPIPKLDMNGGNGSGPYATPLERIPRVDEEHCVGCNLCSLVCPVPDCITMERIDTGLAPHSWEERVNAGITNSADADAGNPNH
jgi:dihydropyrimidine dehydrogenase (NAD+) subunit PreA